jgi:hypothetical protein
MKYFTVEKALVLVSTAVLSKYPNILTIDREGWVLIIPSHVISDLRKSMNDRDFNYMEKLLSNGQRASTVQVVESGDCLTDLYRDYLSWIPLVSRPMFSIFRKVRGMEKYVDVKYFYVTVSDPFAEAFWAETGFWQLQDIQIQELIKAHGRTRNRLLKFVENQKNKKVQKVAFFLLIFAICVKATYEFRDEIFVYRNNLLLIVCATLGSIVLYSFKRKKNVIYGFIEFVVGFFTFFYTVKSLKESLDSKGNAFYLSLLAGLYIMVRGLDNMNRDKYLDQKFKQIYTSTKSIFSKKFF